MIGLPVTWRGQILGVQPRIDLTCSWGCRMAVALIVDQWNPVVVKQRFETFCYGPKSCSWYRSGPTRKAPGRNGMSWEEEDWVDEEAVAHRGVDD